MAFSSWLVRALFVLVFLPFLIFTGCAPTLRSVEREVSLDKIEASNGWKNRNGDHRQREGRLFRDEIVNRQVKVSPHQGYLIQVVNYSSDIVEITVKKSSFFNTNPVTASFLLRPMDEAEHYLPTGRYDVHCTWPGGYWDKTYEVRTAPAFTKLSGELKKYHAVMGNINDRYYSYYTNRYR